MFKRPLFYGFSLLDLKVIRFKLNIGRNLCSQPGVMRVLNVAEKNDAAKNIVKFLSKGPVHRRNGLSKYMSIYDFECTAFGQNVTMIMTSVSGHLKQYDFDINYRDWQAVRPITLFEAPIVKCFPENNELIKKTLEREIKSCSKLIIWTDCDREGENIGFEIIEVCKAVKPNISIHRAKFSEITKSSVEKALNNLGVPNKSVSDAVNVRRILDLRIGAAFTRFQTLTLTKAFPTVLDRHLVSYGSCQFPTLGFVTERFKAISEFIAEKFWLINVQHTKNDLKVDFKWERHRLFDKLACEVLYDKCKEGKVAKVENVESKKKTKWRPKPLDTVELEKSASRKLKINAKETLKIAEKLYLKGLISYPRTDTNMFPKNLDLRPLVQNQTESPCWGEFARKVISEGPNPFQGNKTDEAHPPIHPVKYTEELSGNEKKIYEFIVRHFLACLSKHAEGLETIVEINIADEKFVAKGLMITARNYLEVYPYENWSDKEIHIYRVGDTFQPDISMNEGETSPPELLTEADLISLMEKHGIGTDATHAEHIEKIKERLYVGVTENKYLVPRTLGMGLVEAYRNMGFELAKPELRAQLEADLNAICNNVKSPEEVLATQIQNYKAVFEGVEKQVSLLSETIEAYIQVKANKMEGDIGKVKKCPKCNLDMTLKKYKNSTLLSCLGYPTCKEKFWFPSFVKDVTVMPETCEKCGPDTHLIKLSFKNGSCILGSVYVGCIGCDNILLDALKPSGRKRSPSERKRSPSGSRSNTLTTAEMDDSGFVSEGSAPGITSLTPHCHCGVPASQFTVKKSGPNFGRIFYKCSSPIPSAGCNFFQWKDQNEGQTLMNVSLNNREETDVLRCYCAIPCRRATSKQGREFYACGKPFSQMSERCKFFQWVNNDENNAFSANSNFRNSQRHFSTGSQMRFNQRNQPANEILGQKKRKCGICHQEGHNRKNCPQR